MTKLEAQFEVWAWQHSNTNCFSNQLCSLWCKADMKNKCRFAVGFPELSAALAEWYSHPEPEDLLDEWRKRGEK